MLSKILINQDKISTSLHIAEQFMDKGAASLYISEKPTRYSYKGVNATHMVMGGKQAMNTKISVSDMGFDLVRHLLDLGVIESMALKNVFAHAAEANITMNTLFDLLRQSMIYTNKVGISDDNEGCCNLMQAIRNLKFTNIDNLFGKTNIQFFKILKDDSHMTVVDTSMYAEDREIQTAIVGYFVNKLSKLACKDQQTAALAITYDLDSINLCEATDAVKDGFNMVVEQAEEKSVMNFPVKRTACVRNDSLTDILNQDNHFDLSVCDISVVPNVEVKTRHRLAAWAILAAPLVTLLGVMV